MNKKTQVGVRNGLSVGVLIVGSLYWDLAPHRKDWRANRLNLDDERFVRAPIRYGRRSSTRGCSYTMVFSLGVVGADQSGRAIVVPCKHRAHGIDDLSREAKCLWAAERKPGAQTGSLSADWGCVALLVNPNRAESEPVRKLSSGWTDRVSNERCYGQLNSAVNEDVVVDELGFLRIPWPETEDPPDLEVDVLLATATNPTIVDGHYPSPEQIADAWNRSDGKNYVDYFCKNRAHGIRTSQDNIIEARLRELWA